MNLLDAYPLVALLAEEPAAEEVERILRERDVGVVVANLAEAIDILQRTHDLAADDVRAILGPLFGEVFSIVVSEERDAWLAADLRARHYDRKSRALSLADCFLLAHAIAGEHQIATSDPPLADAARAEQVSVIALPDSAGVRP